MTSRLASAALGVVFLGFAALQLNDPDPLVWTTTYGAAALVCLLEAAQRMHFAVPALVGAGALIGAGTILPRVWGKTTAHDLFLAWGMRGAAAEEGREMLGLAIVAAAMAFVAFSSRRRSRRSP